MGSLCAIHLTNKMSKLVVLLELPLRADDQSLLLATVRGAESKEQSVLTECCFSMRWICFHSFTEVFLLQEALANPFFVPFQHCA